MIERCFAVVGHGCRIGRWLGLDQVLNHFVRCWFQALLQLGVLWMNITIN
jgi:hypothetical protein